MAERLTVFLPSSKTATIKNILYVAYFFLVLIWLSVSIAKSPPKKLNVYFGCLFGLIVFPWSLGEGTYNLIGITNALGPSDEVLLNLYVVENYAAPEGIVSRDHTIKVRLLDDPSGVRRVRYRYPQIDFRNLKAGDVTHVMALRGLAGFTLERVISSPRVRSNNSFKPKPLRGSA
jgi:hypothetical protein